MSYTISEQQLGLFEVTFTFIMSREGFACCDASYLLFGSYPRGGSVFFFPSIYDLTCQIFLLNFFIWFSMIFKFGFQWSSGFSFVLFHILLFTFLVRNHCCFDDRNWVRVDGTLWAWNPESDGLFWFWYKTEKLHEDSTVETVDERGYHFLPDSLAYSGIRITCWDLF